MDVMEEEFVSMEDVTAILDTQDLLVRLLIEKISVNSALEFVLEILAIVQKVTHFVPLL
jgi:hypothetical protein